MAKYRFYIPALLTLGNVYNLNEAQAKHAVQVLRLTVNSVIEIVNGNGILATAIITQTGKKTCSILVNAIETFLPALSKVHIAISPLKNVSRLEWFLEKATEIGVAAITPIICNRTEKENLRTDRLQQIITSAMLQSKQMYMPVLNNAIAFNTFISHTKLNHTHYLIAHCEVDTKTQITNYRHKNTTIIIGPEGDFTTTEIEAANHANFINVSLGINRLRTETAGIVAATALII